MWDRQRDDYPSLDDDGLARVLIRCACLVRARMDVALAPLDLSYAGFAVLEQLEATLVRRLGDPRSGWVSGLPDGHAVREDLLGPLERLAAGLERLREWETYLGRPLLRPPEPWWFIPDRRAR